MQIHNLPDAYITIPNGKMIIYCYDEVVNNRNCYLFGTRVNRSGSSQSFYCRNGGRYSLIDVPNNQQYFLNLTYVNLPESPMLIFADSNWTDANSLSQFFWFGEIDF